MFRSSAKKNKTKRASTRNDILVKRVPAEVQVDATREVLESRVFLNDLSPTGVGLFINTPLDKGAEVSIVIEQPKHLFVKGEVAWCQPYTLNTRILSEEVYAYRMGIRFIFDSPEEAETLKRYCDELFIEETTKKGA